MRCVLVAFKTVMPVMLDRRPSEGESTVTGRAQP
jgi:hypothetical protein